MATKGSSRRVMATVLLTVGICAGRVNFVLRVIHDRAFPPQAV